MKYFGAFGRNFRRESPALPSWIPACQAVSKLMRQRPLEYVIPAEAGIQGWGGDGWETLYSLSKVPLLPPLLCMRRISPTVISRSTALHMS